MREIYLVRHGETDYNKKHIIQGSGVDSVLNETGISQGRLLFDKYKNIDFDIVHISSLQRTQQTVQHFLNQNIPSQKWRELDEINWGIYEGKPGNGAMHQVYKALVKSWVEKEYNAKIEEGESANDLGIRLERFIKHLISTSHQKVLICSHGRTLKALVSLLQTGTLDRMEDYKFNNTGFTKVNLLQNNFEVEFVNDLSHLIVEQHEEN